MVMLWYSTGYASFETTKVGIGVAVLYRWPNEIIPSAWMAVEVKW
jgi:hypothetical protein